MEAGAVPRVASPRMPALAPGLLRLATDARLVGLVREGRSGAFEAVYDRHQRGILSFCRHMLGDQHEAEDAVQHTFMAAYCALHDSQKPIHLRPWLFAIARNRCYSMLRARRERPAADIEEPVTEGLAAEVQRREDLRDLVHDLGRLPDEQRAAIVLAELESLSHAEIAEVLGVPREKVKALVFQARESLLASRTARDTACHEIRQQLAVGRGGALRRGNLRRHLRDCEGCRAYRSQVQRQRKQFAFLLPVAPTLLVKEGLLVAAAGGGAAAVGGSGVIASSALNTGLLKGLVTAVLAGAGTLGTVMVSASDLPVRTLLSGSGNQAAQARVPTAHPGTRGAHHSVVPPAGGSVAAGPAAHAASAARPAAHAAALSVDRAAAAHRPGSFSGRDRTAGATRAHRHSGARQAMASDRTAGHSGHVPPGLAARLAHMPPRLAMLHAARVAPNAAHARNLPSGLAHRARHPSSGVSSHARRMARGHAGHAARLRHAAHLRHSSRLRHAAHLRHSSRLRYAAHLRHASRLRQASRMGRRGRAADAGHRHGRGHR